MKGALGEVGRQTIVVTAQFGRAHIFLWRLLVASVTEPPRLRLWLYQLWSVGVRSVLIIVISGTFVGMVLGLQGYNTLVDFGADESLGVLVALSLVRELGPVLSALLFAGRAGSALTAELGLMKATEQFDAMEMMAVDPVRRLALPRFLAGVVSLPLLNALFCVVGIGGGYFVGVGLLGVDSGAFWSQMQSQVDLTADLGNGVLKSLVFAVTVSWLAIYQGFDSLPTAEGVSAATTRTVVHCAVSVLILDFVLTALMYGD